MQSTPISLLNLIHFALAVFLFLWGVALILPQRQARPLRYFGFLLVLLGINVFYLSMYISRTYNELPHLLGIQFPTMLMIGPCLYFFARSVADAWKPARIHFLHFVPALLAIAFNTPVFLMSVEEKLQFMANWDWENREFGWRHELSRAAIVSMAVYHLIALRVLHRGRIASKFGFLLLLTGGPAVVLLTYGLWIGSLWPQEIGIVFLEVHLLSFYLLSHRDRGWLDRLIPGSPPSPEAEDASGTNREKADKGSGGAPATRLHRLDTDQLLQRLEVLMTEEKCFADEDLDIQRLADLLEIKRHQLSELLNHIIGLDFKSYLNQFRVQEARELLLAEPDRSVLSIAFAVGFNSKSSFHQVFRKFAGVTPTEFRERQSSGEAES
ncbi:MAG: helix-turn-helix domain-containing protein [bacterium]|nr:helix-turn-helix domain-containing protein [bacterium]